MTWLEDFKYTFKDNLEYFFGGENIGGLLSVLLMFFIFIFIFNES